jgi:hypothetical protein
MKKHTKIYCKFFGIGEQDFPICEWCGRRELIDVHHINNRGMGGSKDKDFIENLIGLCRECHSSAHTHRISKDELTHRHELKMMYKAS